MSESFSTVFNRYRMPSVLEKDALASDEFQWTYWAPIFLGFAILFVPTYWTLANTIWKTEEQGHGPIILAVVAWLFWNKREELTSLRPQPANVAGWLLMTFGLVLYVVGRSQDIILFEVFSQISVVSALLLLTTGWSAIRVAWFPVFFLIFMAPVPGFIIDALTAPLKANVSVIAETILYSLGYPVARSGVVLTIGQYQLLVANACSGLNSMFSLSALGLLYVHLMRGGVWWKTAILLASILPIAFVANVVRVMILVLVTYHFGDEAGQGFIHGFAGMVLFVIALTILFAVDAALGLIKPGRRQAA